MEPSDRVTLSAATWVARYTNRGPANEWQADRAFSDHVAGAATALYETMQFNVGPALAAVPSRLSCHYCNASVTNKPRALGYLPYTKWLSTTRPENQITFMSPA